MAKTDQEKSVDALAKVIKALDNPALHNLTSGKTEVKTIRKSCFDLLTKNGYTLGTTTGNYTPTKVKG
jgi:hypothetical protein